MQTIGGYGPDNHLLGLREISKRKLGETPKLFKEKSYKEFLNFCLSTSTLPTEQGILVGYGPVVTDGYGCSYNPCGTHITFCISSFYSSAETSSDFFALSLEGSLLQMRELCLKISSLDKEKDEKKEKQREMEKKEVEKENEKNAEQATATENDKGTAKEIEKVNGKEEAKKSEIETSAAK